MAKEFKTVQVAPAFEQEEIDNRGRFGWELQSSQEINSKESHIEGGFSGNYSVTTTENYVKLIFQRDPSQVKHYNELTAVEREFDAVAHPGEYPKMNAFLFIILFLLWFIPGIIYALSVSKKKKAWQENYNSYTEKRRVLIGKADEINARPE